MDSLLSSNITAKVAAGSYVGTGTYGKDNPMSIVFGFTPKLVTIYMSNNSNSTYVGADGGTWIYGADKGTMHPCIRQESLDESYFWYTPETVPLTWSNNSVSWYTTYSAGRAALNELGATYRWVAIG